MITARNLFSASLYFNIPMSTDIHFIFVKFRSDLLFLVCTEISTFFSLRILMVQGSSAKGEETHALSDFNLQMCHIKCIHDGR